MPGSRSTPPVAGDSERGRTARARTAAVIAAAGARTDTAAVATPAVRTEYELPVLGVQFISAPGTVGTVTIDPNNADRRNEIISVINRALADDGRLVLVAGTTVSMTRRLGDEDTIPGVLCTVLWMNDGEVQYAAVREVEVLEIIQEDTAAAVWRDLSAERQRRIDGVRAGTWIPGVQWTVRGFPGSIRAGYVSDKNILEATALWAAWSTPSRRLILLRGDERLNAIRRTGHAPPHVANRPVRGALVEITSVARPEALRQIAEGTVAPADKPVTATFTYAVRRWVTITGARERAAEGIWEYSSAVMPAATRPWGGRAIRNLREALPGMVTTVTVAPGQVTVVRPEWNLDLAATDAGQAYPRQMLLVHPDRDAATGMLHADRVEVVRRKNVAASLRGIEEVQVDGLLQIRPRTVFSYRPVGDTPDLDTERDLPLRRLRRYLTTLSPELEDAITRLRREVATLPLPDAVRADVTRQLDHATGLPDTSSDRGGIITWVRQVLRLPWESPAPPAPDIAQLRRRMDASHFGLDEAKRRIHEHVAATRWLDEHRTRHGRHRRTLLLTGPPGTGKTSLAAALAGALGQPFQVISVSGLWHASDMLGSRRVWLGSSIGLLLRAIQEAGTRHLVLILDEVDKISTATSSELSGMLLGLLDPDHSDTVYDAYLELPFDISGITFVLTANDLERVHPALQDRCDVVQLRPYTRDEKLTMVRSHLLPRALAEAAVTSRTVHFTRDALTAIATDYSEEPGVRQASLALRRGIGAALVRIAAGESRVVVDREFLVSELGDTLFVARNEVEALQFKAMHAPLPETVRTVVQRELSVTRQDGWERSNALAWVRTTLELPWKSEPPERPEMAAARAALESTHSGLKPVKDAVMDRVAALAWRRRIGDGDDPPLRHILLVGPPGTGKTSIIESIATAMRRRHALVACGSFSDATGLVGTERHYVSSRPGGIVDALRRAGTSHLLLGLDEIDKMARGSMHGDPHAVLLQITDPEQAPKFVDRWLTVPFDVSRMFIVATANDLAPIPLPLRDRFDIIELRGYSLEEKLEIARRHLLPTLRERFAVRDSDVAIADDVLAAVVLDYTAESGVRQLTSKLETMILRSLGELLEKPRRRHLTVDVAALRRHLGQPRRQYMAALAGAPGYAPALYVIPGAGRGDVGSVAARRVRGGRGDAVITGLLEQDFRETVQIAEGLVRSEPEMLHIPADAFADSAIHLHVDYMSTRKGGPSGGVAVVAALVSLARGQAVRSDTVCTGEITLDGRILAVGGIAEKLVAARRAGATTAVIPAANEPDLDELPAALREQLTIVVAAHITEALDVLLPRDDHAASVAAAAR